MEAVVQHLIERGSYVSAEDNCGQTLLHYAVLRVGSKFRKCENMGCPFASSSQHPPNCNIDGDENDGTHDYDKKDADKDESEERGAERVLPMLLEHGANFNSRDMKGYTALHLAAGGRDSSVVELLLQRGAEVNVVDNRGLRSLHLAINEPGNTGLTSTGRMMENLQYMRCLIMVPDIDAKDDYWRTTLHTAAAMKNYSIAEILLGRGAKVNVLDNYRQTPLVSVVRTTRPDSTVNEYIITVLVQLLLGYGANPVLMDFAGRTAQDLAELSRLGLTVDLLRLRTPDSNRCRHCGKKTNTRRCTGYRLVGSVSFTLPPCIPTS
jgi:ankyrin repeat protein